MLIRWETLTKDEFAPLKGKAMVAVNFASTEQHSLHLPVGTDAIIGKAVLERAAEISNRTMLVLPQVCYGFSPHHRFGDGYISPPQRPLIDFACGVCRSVYDQGFKRMFLVNSHGGNQVWLSAVVNELGDTIGEDFELIALRYWDVAAARIRQIRTSEIGGMGHAGEFETSVMMHLNPELVRSDKIFECPPAASNEWNQSDLIGFKKYVKYSNFNHHNVNGNIGQPHLATPQKGKEFFEAVTSELARFFDHFV